MAAINYTFPDLQGKVRPGIFAGIIATGIATVSGYWFPGIGLPKFDFNFLNGVLHLGLKADPLAQYVVGALFAHLFQGIIFALIYVILIHPNLPGPLNFGGNMLRGLIWGWTLYIISSAIWMPALFDTGFFFAKWGAIAAVANFIWHTIYGFHLGALYSPRLATVSGGSGFTSQQTISEAELDTYLKGGWRVTAVLPSGKIVIENASIKKGGE